MDASHHMAAVMELDLTAVHTSSLVDKLNAMPGLKTSAAFFTFLRANLVLLPSDMSSNASTPVLAPTTSISTAAAAAAGLSLTVSDFFSPPASAAASAQLPASASAKRSAKSIANAAAATAADAASSATNNLDDIPPLSLGVLTTHADKAEALQLVADSIAQQRQTASRSLVSHPANMTALVLASGVAYQANPRRDDLGMTVALLCGIVMTYLLAIRYVSGGYIPLAEALGWDFLLPKVAGGDSSSSGNGGGDNSSDVERSPMATLAPALSPEMDTVIGARYGTEMIGALVLRLQAPDDAAAGKAEAAEATVATKAAAGAAAPSRKGKRGTAATATSAAASYLKGGHGVVRAWTTKLRYRRRGLGTDLLHEAVRETRERCGCDATVVFAQDHANSASVLPDMFNEPFRATERLAAQTLERVLTAENQATNKHIR